MTSQRSTSEASVHAKKRRAGAVRLDRDNVDWNSPELLVVVDSEQYNGWQQLPDFYIHGYPATQSHGVYSALPHPGQVAEVGFCVGPYVVVGLLPRFPTEGSGEHHNESIKV
jgi:hypothetical protein